MKKSFYILFFTCSMFAQVHHNVWYGFGPYGGTVSEIASNSRGNIAAITNGGLSYYYYEWIHMYKSQDFTHATFLGKSDTLIATDSDSLYWTNDVSYHWRSIMTLEKPTKGIRVKKLPQIIFFLWADSLIYKGGWDEASWSTLSPGKGIINDLYINQTDDQFVFIATQQGVFRSSDYGENWDVLSLPSKNYGVLSGDNVPPFKLATFSNDSNIVYLSSNNGDTWLSTNYGLPQGEFELTDAVINNAGQIFVSGKSGVYRTTNFGANWGPYSDELVYPDFGVPKTLPVHTLASDDRTIYAGTEEGIFEKNPTYSIWNQIGPNNQKCLALGKSPYYFDVVLLGTPKGVKYSYGNWWQPASNYGQSGFPINALILSNMDDNIALAAGIFPENNGFIQKSSDIGENWETVFNLPLSSGKFNQFFQRKDSTNIYLALNEGLNYSGLLISDVANNPNDWQSVPGTFGLNFKYSTAFWNETKRIFFLSMIRFFI